MKRENDNLKVYIGIADAEGLDSFICINNKEDKEIKRLAHVLYLRSRFNEQRQPLVFRIFLEEDDAELIEDLEDPRHALVAIKDRALLIEAIGQPQESERRWAAHPYFAHNEKIPSFKKKEKIEQEFRQLELL